LSPASDSRQPVANREMDLRGISVVHVVAVEKINSTARKHFRGGDLLLPERDVMVPGGYDGFPGWERSIPGREGLRPRREEGLPQGEGVLTERDRGLPSWKRSTIPCAAPLRTNLAAGAPSPRHLREAVRGYYSSADPGTLVGDSQKESTSNIRVSPSRDGSSRTSSAPVSLSGRREGGRAFASHAGSSEARRAPTRSVSRAQCRVVLHRHALLQGSDGGYLLPARRQSLSVTDGVRSRVRRPLEARGERRGSWAGWC